MIMKHLLRKTFFWDAPAQGVLFGLTLMLFQAWGGFTLEAVLSQTLFSG